MYVLTPDLIAVDKNGKILDFDTYKTEYKKAKESKQEFSINLFYLNINSSKKITNWLCITPFWNPIGKMF